MEKTRTKMKMEYEFITPEIAAEILKKNTNNRKLSEGAVNMP